MMPKGRWNDDENTWIWNERRGGPLMIAAAMGIITAPEAQAPRSGTGNDRTGEHRRAMKA